MIVHVVNPEADTSPAATEAQREDHGRANIAQNDITKE